MSQKTKLQKERAHFTRANAFIRLSREEKFQQIHYALTERLQKAKSDETLREVAREMVDQGYYSPKCPIPQVERMLVVKLFRLSGRKQTTAEWQKFVREVAPAWAAKW